MITASVSAPQNVQTHISKGVTAVNNNSIASKVWQDGIGWSEGSTSFAHNVGSTQNGLEIIPNESNLGDMIIISFVSSGIRNVRMSSTGFGTLSSILTGVTVRRTKMHPSRTAIISSQQNEPTLRGYAWSNSVVGTAYSNPATLPTFTSAIGLGLSRTGDSLVIGGTTTPFFHSYGFSTSTGFGTQRSNTGTASASVQSVHISPQNNYLTVTQDATPFFYVYTYSDATGIGTRLSAPSLAPVSANGLAIEFSPNNSYIAFGGDSTPRIHLYEWTGSAIGTKYSSPASTTSADMENLSWGENSNYVFGVNCTSWAISPSGFGTFYTSSLGNSSAAVDYKPWTKV